MIALALFCLWFLFNGKLTWELAAIGAVISLALAWFTQKYVAPDMTPRHQMAVARRIPAYLRFVWLLIKEITLANFAVMKLILSDRDIVVPKLAAFKTKLATTPARVVLADCITLTPGTITVHLDEDDYLVHCLDESMEDGLRNSEFEKRLLKMEALWAKEMQP